MEHGWVNTPWGAVAVTKDPMTLRWAHRDGTPVPKFEPIFSSNVEALQARASRGVRKQRARARPYKKDGMTHAELTAGDDDDTDTED